MSSAGLISTVEYIIFASNFTDDSFFCGGLPVHYRYNAINMPSVKNQKLKGPTAAQIEHLNEHGYGECTSVPAIAPAAAADVCSGAQ